MGVKKICQCSRYLPTMLHYPTSGKRDEINVLVRTQSVEINLIDECTRAELPLRDVGPFHHFRHYINDETNTPVSTSQSRNGYTRIAMLPWRTMVTSRSRARFHPVVRQIAEAAVAVAAPAHCTSLIEVRRKTTIFQISYFRCSSFCDAR